MRCLETWRPRLRADHRVHLRVELTSDGSLPLAAELAGLDLVGIVSYMHHTPGFGQFAVEQDAWRGLYAKGFEGSDEELEALVEDRKRRALDAPGRRADVAAIAARTDTVLASHDDESPEAAAAAAEPGARISEFPLTAAAAAAAVRRGLGVVMGAPNAWRGGSHLGGLGAREVIAAGDLTALASDYHPGSLLAAVYALADEGYLSWADALALVTVRPADLVGLPDRGRIAPGLRADLIAVKRVGGHPVVRDAWVGGVPGLGMLVEPDRQGARHRSGASAPSSGSRRWSSHGRGCGRGATAPTPCVSRTSSCPTR